MTWAVADAKARFSAVLDKAETEGPQVVRRRKRDFVVITREQLESSGHDLQRTVGERGKRTLAEFFLHSPLRGSGVKIGHVKLEPRHVEF